MLIALAEERGDYLYEILASGIVETSYGGAFEVKQPEQLKRIALSPLPHALAAALDPALRAQLELDIRESEDKAHFLFFVPVGVLHQFAADFPTQLTARLGNAVAAALDPDLLNMVDHRPLTIMATYRQDRSRSRSKLLSAKARGLLEGAREQEKLARQANDPTTNGRPQDIFKLPRPELEHSFSWWCLQLGSMLASPHAARPDYTAVIRELGERCIRTMPLAHAQARAAEAADPGQGITDRYGSIDNEALPRYARWLHKAGDYQGAIRVCELALTHRIEPASAGAFDRALEAARKKLQAPVPRPRRSPPS